MANPTWLWATVGGVEYDLTAAGILWLEHGDGFGLPPMHRFTQRGPQQHGETSRDYRLDPRTITLVAGVDRPNESAIYDARRRLLGIFKPSNTPILLRWDLSNGTVRQIDTYYSGGMTLPIGHAAAGAVRAQNQSGQTLLYPQGLYQRTAIELVAEDPTFYDPTAHVVTISNGTFGSGFTVPLPVPFNVGSARFAMTETIDYAGDWLAYPVIRLIGPLASPIIRNIVTGETLDFTGASIDAGDYWDIDLGYGAKTVTDAAGASQIAYLSGDSDLGTWHLAATPDASSVFPNVVLASASGANNQSAVRLTWRDRFVGF